MKYKYSRKEFLKKVGFLFSKGKILVPNEVDGEELMKLLLAQKEDKKECICKPFTKTITCPIHGIKSKSTPSPEKECKHKWKLTPDTWGETCFYCGKQRKIKTTPSPLEIEDIKEITGVYRDIGGGVSYTEKGKKEDDNLSVLINKLISNQKKLYQLIKEKL